MQRTFDHFIQTLSASCAYLEFDQFERSLSVCSLEMVLAEIKERLCTEIKENDKAESTFKEFKENLIKTIKYVLDNRSNISEIKSGDHSRFQKKKQNLAIPVKLNTKIMMIGIYIFIQKPGYFVLRGPDQKKQQKSHWRFQERVGNSKPI